MNDKKSRIEFVYEIYTQQYNRSLKRDKLVRPEQTDILRKYLSTDSSLEELSHILSNENNVIDLGFIKFFKELGSLGDILKNTYGDTGLIKDAIFQYFLDHDPTKNKEYVLWYINLYADLCNARPQITRINKSGERYSKSTLNHEKIFFEDFGKIADAIDTFNLIKKTKVLSTEQKDVNKYKNYHDFINMVKPYSYGDADDDSNKIHTLNPSEIKCIQNMVDGTSDHPLAELVYENDKWVVVITHDKESNAIFGKNTTWCTAGTRYGTMFDTYNKQGPLFVLVKKGYGSRKAIADNPLVRLQFHFETHQYMDATDKRINILEFLNTNRDIKEFFRTYVIKAVRKKSLAKDSVNTIVEFLSTLGYMNELVAILRDSKVETLCLKNVAVDNNIISRLGEITTLKDLNLSGCELTQIPEGFKNLVNLTSLDVSKNKNLVYIPDFINDLVNLTVLDFSWCNIQNVFDVGGLSKLKTLILDSNPKLTKLPIGIDKCKQLKRISASCCDITEIPEDILSLSELFMLDLHKNENLTSVPEKITALEKIVAVNLDRCNYSNELHNILAKNAKSKPRLCAYYHTVEN